MRLMICNWYWKDCDIALMLCPYDGGEQPLPFDGVHAVVVGCGPGKRRPTGLDEEMVGGWRRDVHGRRRR